MNADDFQNLYKLLRGSKSAFGVLDARTLFLEKKMQAALVKLQDANDSYRQSRTRLMRQDPEKDIDPKAADADRQKRRLERKQEKVREIFGLFDEMLPKLLVLAEREREKEAREEPAADLAEDSDVATMTSSVERPVTPADVSLEFAARFIESEGDRQLELISRSFGFRPVESEDDIHANSVYFIKIKDESFLVHTSDESRLADEVPLISAVDEIPMKTYTREAFVRLGTRRRMVLLTTDADPVDEIDLLESDLDENNETQAERISETVAVAETIQFDSVDAANEPEGEEASGENQVLGMGDFSQLMDSAQRSGLVPNADQIAHFRDREFRLGRYDMAFSGVEAMFASFTAAAAQRTEQLAREEEEIESGRLKISPKDLQAKRTRDQQQDQAVERARSRFQRLINGLQVLMNSQSPAD